ncbi:MAG: acyltransferase family protein [Deferribacterales bacterium]
MRAFAVLAVIIYHYFPSRLKGGFTGVDIFFVISGYLIGGIILNKISKDEFSLSDFYQRRIIRIFPALVLVLAAVLILGWFALPSQDYSLLGKHTFGGASFISNILFASEAGYWDQASETKILLHLWSLGVEEQFYILFPLFMLFIRKLSLRKSLFISFTLLISFSLNILFYDNKVFDFYMPFTRFWEMLSGVSLAYFQMNIPLSIKHMHIKAENYLHRVLFDKEKNNNSSLSINLVTTVGFSLLIFSLFTQQSDKFPGLHALYPVLGTVLCISAGYTAGINRIIFASKIAVWIGLISYPLYLWHWVILTYSRIIFGQSMDRTIKLELLLLSFFLSALTYYFYERPLRYSKKLRAFTTLILIVIMLTIGFFGVLICLKGGISNRWINRQALYNPNVFNHIRIYGEECRDKFINNENVFCKETDVNGSYTVAVVGDSHAPGAYELISKYNAQYNINTVLISLSGGANPIIDSKDDYRYVKGYSDKVVNILQNSKKIKKIFILIRERTFYGNTIKELQNAINEYSIDGRKIYIVQENPVLPNHIKEYFVHPFNKAYVAPPKPTRMQISKEINQSGNHLELLKGAKIIYTEKAFCPENECLTEDEKGVPLYSDNNHLNLNGDTFLLEKVLIPYLNEKL